MGFLRNRLLRRFTVIGRLADLALVGGAGIRLAQRKGWLTDEQVDRLGLSRVTEKKAPGIGSMVLGGAALVRLLRGKRSRR